MEKSVYDLTDQERLQLAVALMSRPNRASDGLRALEAAYPGVAYDMAHRAAHHLYNDGPPAVVAFLADAELFLRDPKHQMHYGVVSELLYHVYNWMQFRELLPNGKQHVLELLAELKQFVADDDREAIVATAKELEEALEGDRDYPQFE